MSNIFFLEKHGDTNIYIKREDLHPFSFGGNKVKIAQELFADMEDRGFSSVISFGSPTCCRVYGSFKRDPLLCSNEKGSG